MKGLIYHDIIKNKLMIITVFAVTLFYMVLIIAMKFDAETVLENSGDAFTTLLCICCPMIFWINLGVMSNSMTKGSEKAFLITFPQGKKGYIQSKFIFGIMMIVTGIIFTIIMIFISSIKVEAKTLIIIFSILLDVFWIELAFVMIFGEGKANIIIVGIVLIFAFWGLVWLLFGDLTFLVELTSEKVMAFVDKFTKIIGNAAIIANPILMVLSYLLTVKFMPIDTDFEFDKNARAKIQAYQSLRKKR